MYGKKYKNSNILQSCTIRYVSQAASSPRNSRAETDVTSISAGREANSDRSSQVVGSAANSVFSSGQHSLTYKELEEQVKFLQV